MWTARSVPISWLVAGSAAKYGPGRRGTVGSEPAIESAIGAGCTEGPTIATSSSSCFAAEPQARLSDARPSKADAAARAQGGRDVRAPLLHVHREALQPLCVGGRRVPKVRVQAHTGI